MKARTILITSFLLFIIIELISAENTNKESLIKPKRFMQDNNPEGNNNQNETDKSEENNNQNGGTENGGENNNQNGGTENGGENNNQNDKDIGQNYPLNSLNFNIGYELCKEFLKPSKAFTIVLMIYMVLIIAGSIIVVVLLKKELEK